MDFLKKHYEKVILSVVLLGLAVAAGFLLFRVSYVQQSLKDNEDKVPALYWHEWVEAWVQPYIYLPVAVRDGAERDRVVRAVTEHLTSRPGVARVVDTRDAERLRASDDAIDAAIGRSLLRVPPGDVYVVPSEWSVAEEELPAEAGTSHGSPWRYDREVPVIFSGPGVVHGETNEADVPLARVATTLARLLGISAPDHADRDALPGAP